MALVKIGFRLVQDKDGYPPIAVESLWCRKTPGGYILDNVPFYAVGISCADTISAEMCDGMLEYVAVIKRSGHSTIRVAVFNVMDIPGIRSALENFGCYVEVANVPNLLAIDVSKTTQYGVVMDYLRGISRSGIADYEEACIQHRTL